MTVNNLGPFENRSLSLRIEMKDARRQTFNTIAEDCASWYNLLGFCAAIDSAAPLFRESGLDLDAAQRSAGQRESKNQALETFSFTARQYRSDEDMQPELQAIRINSPLVIELFAVAGAALWLTRKAVQVYDSWQTVRLNRARADRTEYELARDVLNDELGRPRDRENHRFDQMSGDEIELESSLQDASRALANTSSLDSRDTVPEDPA